MASEFDRQALTLREHALSIAEETFINASDASQKLMRIKQPHEFAQVQSEFMSRQAEIVADQVRESGQTMMKYSDELANSGIARIGEATRKTSKAA